MSPRANLENEAFSLDHYQSVAHFVDGFLREGLQLRQERKKLDEHLYDAFTFSPEHPYNWPGTCKRGKNQSPIILNYEEAKQVNWKPLHFTKFEVEDTASVTNNGHTVQYKLDHIVPKVRRSHDTVTDDI